MATTAPPRKKRGFSQNGTIGGQDAPPRQRFVAKLHADEAANQIPQAARIQPSQNHGSRRGIDEAPTTRSGFEAPG